MSEPTIDLGPEEPISLGAEEPVGAAPGTRQPSGDDLGVIPMPPPPSLTAFRAQRAGVDPAGAAQALGLAQKTGLGPQFVADNLATVQQRADQSDLAARLARAPATAAYAGQSAVHAAAVKGDVGFLEALEQGFLDLDYGAVATRAMSSPSAQDGDWLHAYEVQAAEIEQRHSGWLADIARNAPSLATYYLAEKVGQVTGAVVGGKAAGPVGVIAGGKAGGPLAVAATMFALNRGVLYRRIMQQIPVPESDQDPAAKDFDPVEYEQRARTFATAGGVASAAIGAGISSVASMALPGGAVKIQSIATSIVARAFTDPAASAVVRNLSAIGVKTLTGAAMMAVPAAIDEMTVEQAATGKIDPERVAEAGWRAFKTSLLAAGVLSTLGHGPELLHDFGAAHAAKAEQARLDAQVTAAKQAQIVQRAPAEAEGLIGKMAAGSDAQTVYVDPKALAAQPDAAAKLVEALADEGQAIAEAHATGTDVAVPIEKYLVHVAPDHHDALREDVKLSPDGVTPRHAGEALPEIEQQLAALNEPLNAGKLQEIASRRRLITPTETEITKALGDLRGLGFQVEEPKPVEVGGTTQEAAGGGGGAGKPPGGPAAAGASGAAPEPPARPSASAREWAAQTVGGKTIGELQPGRYDLAARRAEDHLAAMAVESAKSASKPGQEVNATVKMAKTADLTEARDRARAVAEHMAEVKAETDKAQKYILSRATPEHLAQLALAGPEYEGAFRSIVAALGDGKGADPAALDALLQRMGDDAEPIGFDPDQVRQLLAQPRDWSKLTPPEARNLLDAVKNLRAAAHRVNEIALSDRKQSLRDFVDGVRAHLDTQKVPDSGLPPPSHAGEGKIERAGKELSKMGAEALQPREILRRLGPNGTAVYDAFVSSRNARDELARQVGTEIWRAYQENMPAGLKKIRLDGVKGPGSPVVNDNVWTRQDLWNLLAWMGNDSNKQRALDGLRITEEQARTALGQLSAPEVHFVEALHKLNDEKLWPLIRAHQKRVTGTTPPKIEAAPFTLRTADGEVVTMPGGYWPARYEAGTAARPANDGTIDGFWGNLRDGFSGVAKSFTKERAARFVARPDLNFDSYASHANSVLQFLAFDDFVRNGGRVLQDKEFRNLVERRLGPQELAELDKFVATSARGSLDGAEGARTWNRLVGAGLRSRVATAAFGLNVPIVLGQLSHIPAAMFGQRIGPIDMARALGRSFIPETWREAHAESQQLPYRWNGYSSKLREQLDGIGPGGDRATFRRWLDAASSAGYHTMDGFLSKVIYDAAKIKAGGDPKAGDAAVAAMMPPLHIAEQSSLARDRGMIGSLLLVRNFPNVLLNVGAQNAWQARTEMWQSGDGARGVLSKAGAGALATGSYLGMVLSAHLFGRFLMGHGRREDETPAEWAERQALTAPFYPVPFGEEIAGPVAEALVNDKPLRTSFRAAPAIAALESEIKDIGKAFSSDAENMDRINAGLRAMATALRLPSYPLRPGRYALDLAGGDASPRGPFDVAGGLFYGQRQGQERNPFTTAQDLISGE